MSTIAERLSRLEHRVANMMPAGRVIERDHEKGVRLNLGTDEKPFPSPWIQPGDRTGASRYLPEVGEQVRVIADGGDWTQATLIPYTHSKDRKNPAEDADETVHHNRDGERRSVRKGHARHQAAKKMSLAAGDGGKKAEGKGSGGSNLRHEANAQLQGIRATLTQHDNNIAGLHKAASTFRAIVQQVIPQVQQVEHLLKGDPDSLGKAAEEVLGQLEGYVAKTFQQMVGKLTNGFMGNVLGLVQGFMSGQIGGLLGSVSALAAQHGVEGAVAGALSQAQGLVESAAAGAAHDLLGQHLDTIQAAFAGTPGEAAFGLLRGQIGGALSAATGIAGDLAGALDGQQNLVKGMTKSMRFGGYEGAED